MKAPLIHTIALLSLMAFSVQGQTPKDSLEIKQVALDCIESQHDGKPEQFERFAHPRMVK